MVWVSWVASQKKAVTRYNNHFSSRLSGSLAKFLMIALDRTGLEDPVLGTEIDRNLPSTACSRRCGDHTIT
jgi:hypothetical protein